MLQRLKEFSAMNIHITSTHVLVSACLALTVAGCTSTKPKMAESEFAPMVQIPVEPPGALTGSIYNGGRNDNWFGRKRDYKVGDIITVILNEETQADRRNSTTASRETSNDVMTGLAPKLPFPKAIAGLPLTGSTIESNGSGTAAQQASLRGSIAATVTQVLPNGNLIVRGEKQLDLSEGSETIRVAGIVRTDDVGPDGTVFSRRLANAQISYTGTGDLANASKVSWGTGLLMKLWPF
jgi:flagellar L-ring protein precursor FlgH